MFIYIIVGIILFMYVFDLLVSYLNYRNRHKPLPENVSDIYDEASYKKWLSYSMEQTKLGFIDSTFSIVVVIGLLIFGGFALFNQWAESLSPNSYIFKTNLFILFYFAVYTLVSIPFSYIETFKIEEKYGFNKSTRKTFIKDQVKNFLLMGSLLFGLVSGITALFQAFKDQLIFVMIGSWALLVFITLLIAYLNTKVFVKIFNKLTPLEDGDLKDRIIEMAHQVGFEIKAISIMDASKRTTKLNAFFSGMGKTREVVLFDTLMSKLSEDEILAVLAHEFGHMVHKDIPKMMIQRMFMYLVFAGMLLLIFTTSNLFLDFNLPIQHVGFTLILFTLFLEPIGLLLGVITNHLSRQAEYKADAYSASLIDKKHMLSALKKLVKENFSNLNPHPLYEKIHYTHPKISDRIKAIESL